MCGHPLSTSAPRGVGRARPGILPPLLPDERKLRWHATALTIRRTDGKDQIPLLEKRPVSGKDRVARVVNARRFCGRAIQFDDLKFFTGSQVFLTRVADVVTSDEKTCKLLRNVVNPRLEFRRAEPRAVAEDAALRVVAR